MRVAGTSLGLALLFALCASFCLTELAEVDLHWHLLAGERILREKRVPIVDTFTYTSAGRPWIDLHWLFQVLLAAVHDSAGWAGLDALKIGIVTGAFLLAVATARRRRAPGIVVAPLLLLSILASQERFTLRPEALSFLFLAAILFLLGERERRPRLLWAIPPLMALCANCHALYVVGVAVLLAAAVGDVVEGRRDRGRADPPARTPAATAWTAAVSLAATLVNPYGWAGWLLPWRLLTERIAGDTIYARTIAEFQPPLGGYEPTASIAAFVALVAVVLAALVAGRRAARVADVLVLAELLALALLARRNIALFALAAIPCAAPALDAALRRGAARAAALLGPAEGGAGRVAGAASLVVPVLTLALLGDVWSNRFFERDGTQRYFGRGPSPGFYPEGAADFVLAAGLPGEILHDMTMGGYLAWRLSPSRRTFIDGRLEVHDPDLYSTYLRMQTDP